MDDDKLIAEFIRTVQGSDDKTLIEVKVIGWDGPHTPVSSWVTAKTLGGTQSPEKLQKAILRVLETKKFFRTCKDCGERNPVGWMTGNMGVCHACAERNHGIVF